MLLTMTLLDIQIAAAQRTQSLAILAAQRPNRRRQKHLLAQGVFQKQAFAHIIADFGLGLADGRLIGAPIHPLRAVDQIKNPIHIVADRLQTASTAELEMRLNAADQPDVLDILMMAAMFHNQIGTTLTMQRAHLAKFSTEVDGAWLITFVKLQIVEFEFPNTNQHSSTSLRPYLSLTSQLESSQTFFPMQQCQGTSPVFQAKFLKENSGRDRWAGAL